MAWLTRRLALVLVNCFFGRTGAEAEVARRILGDPHDWGFNEDVLFAAQNAVGLALSPDPSDDAAFFAPNGPAAGDRAANGANPLHHAWTWHSPAGESSFGTADAAMALPPRALRLGSMTSEVEWGPRHPRFADALALERSRLWGHDSLDQEGAADPTAQDGPHPPPLPTTLRSPSTPGSLPPQEAVAPATALRPPAQRDATTDGRPPTSPAAAQQE